MARKGGGTACHCQLAADSIPGQAFHDVRHPSVRIIHFGPSYGCILIIVVSIVAVHSAQAKPGKGISKTVELLQPFNGNAGTVHSHIYIHQHWQHGIVFHTHPGQGPKLGPVILHAVEYSIRISLCQFHEAFHVRTNQRIGQDYPFRTCHCGHLGLCHRGRLKLCYAVLHLHPHHIHGFMALYMRPQPFGASRCPYCLLYVFPDDFLIIYEAG